MTVGAGCAARNYCIAYDTNLNFNFSFFNPSAVTSDESNRTWGRSTSCHQEEFEEMKQSFKKRGCTWGPNSVQTKERVDCKERYSCCAI